ncbi:NAD(P)H-hydrate epimerase [Phytophthora nicotianae]|uniref:NAD(P)H-hydrate epimerase n=1 Tax=Phytophthora nicotianae TaxID=4792 RepID=A0A0W8C9P5_PHYNI|nr:NAD(P)H-hydrate epimerase [Phytophthora nicotianae]KUF84549.1 NAD(P)H-hydrate epimerase [Phytophthora nicotianae]
MKMTRVRRSRLCISPYRLKLTLMCLCVYVQYLGQREAQHFDEQLMSSTHGFSIDQLMELAGLSVATAVGKQYPTNTKSTAATGGFKRVLVVAGPGNNGILGIRRVFCIRSAVRSPFSRFHLVGLVTQCEQLKIPFIEQIQNASDVDAAYDLILDGIFGFSFSGGIRPPFDHVVGTLQKCQTPIVSIDIPSGWHVEKGNESGVGLEPQMLVSLTAPKLCAKLFTGPDKVHYVGGRFVSKSLAEEFNLELPEYPGVEQCVKVPIPY